MFDTMYRIDFSQVSKEIIDGLLSGKMQMSSSNGNVYWSAGSGNTGIVKQLPFIKTSGPSPQDILNLQNMVQSAQTATVVAASISTAVIVGAIVIQTAYLSKRISAVSESVHQVGLDVHMQSVVGYIEKISRYFGVVEAGRQLIADPALVNDVRDVAPTIIANLSMQRHDICLFIKGLLDATAAAAAAKNAEITETQYRSVVEFVIEVLNRLPMGMMIERELAGFVDKYTLSESVRRSAGEQYRSLLNEFRTWCNQQIRSVATGRSAAAPIHDFKDRLETLFYSQINEIILGDYSTTKPIKTGGSNALEEILMAAAGDARQPQSR